MILFSMFLAALNMVNRFYIFVFAGLMMFIITPKRKLRVNNSVFILGILGIAVSLFNPQTSDRILDMIKPFTYFLSYIMGFGLIQYKNYDPADLRRDEKRVSSVIYVMAGGALLHFLLNMITNLNVLKREMVIDFWTKSEMAATGQAALACLAIAVSIAFLFTKVGKWKKIIAITAITLIMVYNLILAGRTLFVLIIIIVVAALLYLRIVEKKKISKAILICVAIILVLLVLYQANIFGIRTTVESSNFYLRFYGGTSTQELNDDARWAHKRAYLEHFLEYPLGGGNIRRLYGHSAHDLYLDTYDESGAFAFLAIVIYIISSLIRLVKCVRNKNISLETRLLVFCVYLVCNMEFWLEPIMRGMPWLLTAYCFIDGAVTYLLMREKDLRFNARI